MVVLLGHAGHLQDAKNIVMEVRPINHTRLGGGLCLVFAKSHDNGEMAQNALSNEFLN
jgi:hypothetical protein